MAAYNGQNYIAEQIESILSQTEQNWGLVIQDDCSSDGTYAIAKNYARQYPKRIHAVRRQTPSGSAQNNFFSMLRFASDSEYIMFCDDDDVWLPEKIHVTLSEMQNLEKRYGFDKPLLVHTDLRVTDSSLNIISESMMNTQKLDPERNDLNRLLVQNIVTGNTMMINGSLLTLTTKYSLPEHAVMHDWWLALVASALGKIGFVTEGTVLYRQHTNNQIGAQNARSLQYNVLPLLDGAGVERSLNKTYKQAEEFLAHFGTLLKENQIQLLRDFISIPSCGKPERLWILLKNGCWKNGFLRKFGQVWFC